MQRIINRIGFIVLLVGIALLVTGIILAVTVGNLSVPLCLSSSILVNSAGIFLLRYRKNPKGE